ncbi:MAG: NAD-dependent epimerase/dehydratase family protein [Planctomycetaceae bacterium]|jgi:farnesol dehydrogenase|nr:NAD-dependent epimerase/dehydratase family protein [Planctomycetaceae bacterium]
MKVMKEVMNVFVTGSTGFIGRKLTERLVQLGYFVRGLARRVEGLPTVDGVEYVCGDVTDIGSLRRGMSGCRYVFHLAAYANGWARNSTTYNNINITGTKNVFSVAKEFSVERLVWTSTIVTLGPTPEGVIGDESMPRITDKFLTEYERSKTEMEQEAMRWIAEGLPLVIVNPTRVYGPGLLSESNTVTQLISMFRRGRMPVLLNYGRNVGNYVFVDDVVCGLILALERGRIGERYILGGENVSLKGFFETINKIDNKKRYQREIYCYTPLLLAYIFEWNAKLFGIYPLFTPGWIRTFLVDWAYSSKKAESELGYKITSLENGIRKTCKWLDENKTHD